MAHGIINITFSHFAFIQHDLHTVGDKKQLSRSHSHISLHPALYGVMDSAIFDIFNACPVLISDPITGG